MRAVKLRPWIRRLKRLRIEWLSTVASVVIAACSMVIALCSLTFTIHERRVARQHDKLSVQPHLFMSFYYDTTGVGWRTINDGVGPARLRGFKLLVDGVSQKASDPFPDAISNPLKIPKTGAEFLNPAVDTVLQAGGMVQSVWFHWGSGAEAIKANASRIGFEVCYCSIYDECWLFSSANLHGKRDDTCSTFKNESRSWWWDG